MESLTNFGASFGRQFLPTLKYSIMMEGPFRDHAFVCLLAISKSAALQEQLDRRL
jgi:hypothetical protein